MTPLCSAVLVLELSPKHVSHSFEAAVRVVREAAALVDRQHVEERVVAKEFRVSDRSTDTDTYSLGLFSLVRADYVMERE